MTTTIFLVFIIVLFWLSYKIFRGPHRVNYLISTVVLIAASYGVPGRYISNRLEVMVNPYYMIPSESSLSKFKPTIYDKQGSGNNWIYAEDDKNYYYAGSFAQNISSGYVFVSRDVESTCNGFKVHDFKTWCITDN